MRIHNPHFPTAYTADSEAFLPELLAELDITSATTLLEIVIPVDKRDMTSYFIYIHGLRAAVSGDLKLRFSFDGGSTYEGDASDYELVGMRINNVTATNFTSTGANAMFISDPGGDIASSSGKAYSGMVWTHFRGDETNLPRIYFQGSWINTAGSRQTARGSGHYDKSAKTGVGYGTVNAFQFRIGGQDITRAQIRLYGID